MSLEKIIEESKSILNLKENWDDEGALPVDEELYYKSLYILKKYYRFSDHSSEIKLPQISLCRDGSIDLYWNDLQWSNSLLVNVSKKDNKFDICYYGDKIINNIISDVIRGNIEENQLSYHILIWIKHLN